MAGIAPSFITGAKAIVKIYDTALAFCSDVSYSVNVQHVPIEALGIFEIISHEPVAYTVEGSFSVVRYARNSSQLQQFADAVAGDVSEANTASSMANDNDQSLKNHIDPRNILNSVTFDLEVVEKGTSVEGAVNSAKSFFKITECRITRRNSSLNKRGVLIDNYAFVGRFAQDDVDTGADVVGASTVE